MRGFDSRSGLRVHLLSNKTEIILGGIIAICYLLAYMFPHHAPQIITIMFASVSVAGARFGLKAIQQKTINLNYKGLRQQVNGTNAQVWGFAFILFSILFLAIYLLGVMDFFHTGKIDFKRLIGPQKIELILDKKTGEIISN